MRKALLSALGLFFILSAAAAHAQPTFSKVFTPNIIGPGSVSTITFTITNGGALPVTGLSFTDTLPMVPGPTTIADPANISTSCDLGLTGTLTAPDNGSTITLANGQIGALQSCTITVDVTASTPGAHTNPAITLSSSNGSSMSLPVDLTVATNRPGFSKSFSPSSISLGGRSTLTFTIDNALNASVVGNLDFVDNLPSGMVIADPANAVTDCIGSLDDTTLTAAPGTSVITLDANGSTFFPGFEVLAAGAACTVTVDVTSTGAGMLDNLTGDLLADFTSSGKASATLEVTATPLALTKTFTDDPIPPGGTATLEFTLTNFNRTSSATGVTFTDDLGTLVPALPGLIFASELANDCGVPASGIGGTTLSLSGVTLPPEGMCTLRVSLAVPPGAIPGAHVNTTNAVSATVDGSPVVGNMASDTLFVAPSPILTKEFLEAGTLNPDPVVAPGDDVVLRFTVTNPSPTSMATDIAFLDELTNGGPGTGFLPFPISVTLPPTPCGAGSSLAITFPGTDRQALSLTGGSLDPAPGAGSTCTFDVTVSIPDPFPPGIYVNTTEEITATIDGATRTGDPASDTLTVIAAPALSKAFQGPVAPGGTVTLEFSLSYPADASGDATGITFTDNLATLDPVLAGLTATGLPLAEACDPDGPGGEPGTGTLSGSAGDTLLTLMGASLSPGESCTFAVSLAVPPGTAPGFYTNTTSGVAATVEGLAATSTPASDDLAVAGLSFSKEFLGDPVLPGQMVTLRFTIDNIHPTDDATITFFTDNLSTVLPGLAATGPATVNTCGGALSGTSSLLYVGGMVLSGQMCTIEVPLLVPPGAVDGSYLNATSTLSATQGGAVIIEPATDLLDVNSNLIQLTKVFTDDPVAPGDSVTLEFTLTNLDATQPVSAAAFTDDLAATLPGLTFDSVLFNGCGGTVQGTTTTMIDVSDVALTAGGSCVLQVSLSVPGSTAAGLYVNTTSDVTGTLGGFAVSGDPANDELEVVQLLGFSKSFDGPTTATGTATLTFTITNPGTDSVDGINFSDDLDSVISGLIAISLPAVPCGAGSSITGTSFLAFEDGELPPMGGMCSFDVEVLVPAGVMADTYPNVTSDLTRAGLVVSDPATADLVIEPPPGFAKAFVPDTLFAGELSTLTFTIDNGDSALAADELAFIDNLPAGVVVATPATTSNDCGGTLTATAGSGMIELEGGSVAAGASCTIEVAITSIVSGMHVNTTGDLTSTSGNSDTASDTLTVIPSADLSVTKTDGVTTATPGETVTYTIVVTNPGPSMDPSVMLSDTFPTPPLSCTYTSVAAGGAAGNTAAGMGDLTETLAMPAGSSVTYTAVCTIDPGATGTLSNTVTITASINDPDSGNNSATDNDTVLEPATDLSITKSDSPDPTIAGATITYTLVVTNNGPSNSTGATVTDMLPVGVSFASSADCSEAGGTVTCAIGALAPSASQMATFVVNVDPGPSTVISNTATVVANESDPVPGNNSATAETTVNTQPGFSKKFDPNPLPAGDTAVLTFTIDNSTSTVAATALDFTDNLPADLVIASPANASTTCAGGTLTATAGTGVITYTGGMVAAMSTCTVTVDVTGDTPGMYENVTGDLTSSLGNSGNATETLVVTDNDAPVVTALLTGAGPLAECDTVTLPIQSLRLTIEDGNTPVLGAGNPAAYLLVGTGPDGDFSTVDCSGGVAGDDVVVAIAGLTLDDSDPLAVEVTFQVAETDGLYRFSVCDSITDSAGNALDGDNDGNPGGDFVLSVFRADPLNHFVNGHFDDCPVTLDPWVVASTPPNAIQVGTPGTDDVESSPLSASAHVAHSADAPSLLGQCVSVTGGVAYGFEASLRFDPPMGALASFSRTCEFFAGPLCGGASLGSSSNFSLIEDEGGLWITSLESILAPVGAVSALCELGVAPVGDDPNFDIYLDALFLGAEGLIFRNGFESGDTSAWSSTSP